MAQVACPQRCRNGYHYSSGDGWEEWDECKCCNPEGENDSGMVSEDRLAAYRAEVTVEEARVEAIMNAPCEKCGVATWACECSKQQSTQ